MPLRVLCVLLSSITFAAEKPKSAPREFALAKVTLTSGKTLVVNYRLAAPAKVNRAAFSWRSSVRCQFQDRGDESGLPSVESLRSLQSLEAKLESPGAIRLMTKTGEGARETVYQVKDHQAFEAALPDLAKAAALECTVSTSQDLKWAQWEAAKATLAKAPPQP
jgi:hypothetical protein